MLTQVFTDFYRLQWGITTSYKAYVQKHTNSKWHFCFGFLFKVHKGEVIECSDVGGVGAAFVINVLDKFERFFVSVDKGEGIILWIHCQKLWQEGNPISIDGHIMYASTLDTFCLNQHPPLRPLH